MPKQKQTFPIPPTAKKVPEILQVADCEITAVAYLGLDVHKNFYQAEVEILLEGQVVEKSRRLDSESKAVLDFITEIEEEYKDENLFFITGYESGPTGVDLKLEMNEAGYHCDMIPAQQIVSAGGNKKIKTDRRDAKAIVKTLQLQDYKAVYVASLKDRDVKKQLRYRYSLVEEKKHKKQQVKAILLEKNLHPKPVKKNGKKVNICWSQKYFDWLREVEVSPGYRQVLDDLIEEILELEKRIDKYDKAIKKIARSEQYKERVQTLMCFVGIAELTALSLIVEIGDFERFPTPGHLASYLGLVPGEKSSGNTKRHCPITKAGNRYVRKLLCQATCNLKKASRAVKSNHIKEKQKNCSIKMVAYADRCFQRLIHRNMVLFNRGKNARLINTALARELACFVWGAMNNKID